MIYEAVILTLIASHLKTRVHLLKIETYDMSENGKNHFTDAKLFPFYENNTNATVFSFSENRTLSSAPDIFETSANNAIETYNSSILKPNKTTEVKSTLFSVGKMNESIFSAISLLKKNNVVANESFTSGNISELHNYTDFDKTFQNTTHTNDRYSLTANFTKNASTQTTEINPKVTEILLKQEKHKHLHPTKSADEMRLSLEKKKVMLQHHLQLVPMEDRPLDSKMLKSQRYLISVLVPVGVGMIGAVMIVCTVVILRKVARRRLLHKPLDDDIEAETSIASHISSISTCTTEKMFLLHTDEI